MAREAECPHSRCRLLLSRILQGRSLRCLRYLMRYRMRYLIQRRFLWLPRRCLRFLMLTVAEMLFRRSWKRPPRFQEGPQRVRLPQRRMQRRAGRFLSLRRVPRPVPRVLRQMHPRNLLRIPRESSHSWWTTRWMRFSPVVLFLRATRRQGFPMKTANPRCHRDYRERRIHRATTLMPVQMRSPELLLL